MPAKIGPHFLFTPGPTPLPQPVLAAMNRNSADISAPEFIAFTRACIDDLRQLFATRGEVFAYAANGHGAWEAALANTLAPGDRVLVPVGGHFAEQWAQLAEALGLQVERLTGDWRAAVDPQQLAARLANDRERGFKALLLVHTDTATGITNDVAAARRALDEADHPALLLVDAVASLACSEFRMDNWRVDVAVAASQKGLMAPPGLGFVAVGPALLETAEHPHVGAPRRYWDWRPRRAAEWYRWFCGTAPTHLVYALRAAVDLILAEGLENVYARHRRLAAATRAAVAVWGETGGLTLNARDPAQAAASVTTVRVPEGHDANQVKTLCYERFNVSLGGGLSRLDGQAFRIGHMGAINEAALFAALGSVEASLRLCAIPHCPGGVTAAVRVLSAD